MLRRVTRQILDENDGCLPSYAWPGGYPLYYLNRDGDVLCPDCTDKLPEAEKLKLHYGINWEEPDLFCDFCNSRIESAYAEEEE